MQHTVLLQHDGPVGMHWGPLYPERNDVLLAYFKDDPRLFICRVESTDELGGNLVELQLHRADVTEPRRFRDVIRYDLYHGDPCTIVAWERISRMKDDEWYAFLDQRSGTDLWRTLTERMSKPPQPVPDGKGGYTRQTIAYSLSREYQGP